MLVKLGSADLVEGELRSYEVGERHVLVAYLDGQLHALNDQCNHAGCLLSSGWLDGRAVVCPCHEYTFDLVTGQNVTFPRLCEDQMTYKTRVEGGEIVVELPEDDS